MSDTMFPNISVMRYRINAWRVVDDWVVTINCDSEFWDSPPGGAYTYTIMSGELKVHDLLHVLQNIVQEVAASTP